MVFHEALACAAAGVEMADAAVSVAGLVEVSDDHDMPAAPSAADGGGPDLANDASDGAFMTGLVAESSVDLVDFNADVGRPCRLGGRKGDDGDRCALAGMEEQLMADAILYTAHALQVCLYELEMMHVVRVTRTPIVHSYTHRLLLV